MEGLSGSAASLRPPCSPEPLRRRPLHTLAPARQWPAAEPFARNREPRLRSLFHRAPPPPPRSRLRRGGPHPGLPRPRHGRRCGTEGADPRDTPASAPASFSCTATAHWTASTALGNSASTLSPAVLAILPPWSRISPSMTSRAAAIAHNRPGLVLADQARVPGHVRSEDRRQPTFDPLFVWWLHRSSPALGNGAPGAAGVQAGRFRQAGDVPRWLRPSVQRRSSPPCRITAAHRPASSPTMRTATLAVRDSDR